MRLGGPLFEKYRNPEEWVRIVRQSSYRAAYCPVGPDVVDEEVYAYASMAQASDIVIAEVGAANMLHARNHALDVSRLSRFVHALAEGHRPAAVRRPPGSRQPDRQGRSTWPSVFRSL